MVRRTIVLSTLASVVKFAVASASASATDYDSAQIAADYASLKGKNPIFLNDRFTVDSALGDIQGKDIADLACGDGFFARIFKRRGAHRVVGVDLSSDMVAMAKAVEAKAQQGIEYHTGDCKNLQPLGIGTVDIAFASYLLNYLATPTEMFEAFRGIGDVLPPGGRFVGVTVNPTPGLPDFPKEWFAKHGLQCYGYGKPREEVLTGELISCDINKMDGTDDPIHLDVYYHDAKTYEDAAQKAGFSKFEWVPLMRHPDNVEMPKEFIDWTVARVYVATKAGEPGKKVNSDL